MDYEKTSDYLNKIVFNFPYIFSAITLSYLLYRTFYNKKHFVFCVFFIAGFFANKEISKTLKLYFKASRPKENEQAPEENNPEKYGFPSGHAQVLFFAISFLLCSVFYLEPKRFKLFFILSSFFGIATCVQRWITHMHTIQQLLGGIFFGSLVGTSIFMISKMFYSFM